MRNYFHFQLFYTSLCSYSLFFSLSHLLCLVCFTKHYTSPPPPPILALDHLSKQESRLKGNHSHWISFFKVLTFKSAFKAIILPMFPELLAIRLVDLMPFARPKYVRSGRKCTRCGGHHHRGPGPLSVISDHLRSVLMSPILAPNYYLCRINNTEGEGSHDSILIFRIYDHGWGDLFSLVGNTIVAVAECCLTCHKSVSERTVRE